MASSSYYYDLYKTKKAEVSKYEDYIDDLQDIYNNFSNYLNDKISNVNNEIDDLESDMAKAVRYNSVFTAVVNNLDDEKQPYLSSDSYLSKAKTELSEEITSLKSKKNTAEDKRDYYYTKYQEAKAEEPSFLESLFG